MSATIGAVWAEAVKAFTLRPFLLPALAAVAACVAATALMRQSADGATAPQIAGAALGFAQAGPVAVAAVLGASEYRGGQRATSLCAIPRRGVSLVARWVVGLAASAVVAGVVVVAVALVGGLPIDGAGGIGVLGGLWPRVVWVAAASWAALLVADAARSSLAGAGVVLAVVWIGPAALRAASPAALRFLPDAAAADLLGGFWPGSVPWAALGWLGACALASALAARREP